MLIFVAATALTLRLAPCASLVPSTSPLPRRRPSIMCAEPIGDALGVHTVIDEAPNVTPAAVVLKEQLAREGDDDAAAATTADADTDAIALADANAITDTGTEVDADAPRGLDARIYGFNKLLVDVIKGGIDVLYRDNDFARFYVLETVARVPYFAYLSVMHLQETFGERDPTFRDRMRVHYAEADNELHHLLIMESLGGNSSAVDRTLAQGLAFSYYWYVVGVYAVSPRVAYHLSEIIEDHAYATYDDFLARRGDELRTMPVPRIAREYYEADNPFLFDLVSQTCRVDEHMPTPTPTPTPTAATTAEPAAVDDPGDAEACPRRPKLASLYDVFVCVRNDEREHWESLCTLVQRGELLGGDVDGLRSTVPLPPPPAAVGSDALALAGGVAALLALCTTMA